MGDLVTRPASEHAREIEAIREALHFVSSDESLLFEKALDALDRVASALAVVEKERDQLQSRAEVAEIALEDVRQERDQLLDDVHVLMDHHTSDELKAEARHRIIERHATRAVPSSEGETP